jgi:hypothetical protein
MCYNLRMDNNWISVRERLPPPDTRVLVAVTGAQEATLGWHDALMWCFEDRFLHGVEYLMDEPVTHWMPLPALPQTASPNRPRTMPVASSSEPPAAATSVLS